MKPEDFAHAVAAQFGERVSDTIANGRIAVCEECARGEAWRVPVVGVVRVCTACDCILSVNGRPYPVLGWKPKTLLKGEHCPEGKW